MKSPEREGEKILDHKTFCDENEFEMWFKWRIFARVTKQFYKHDKTFPHHHFHFSHFTGFGPEHVVFGCKEAAFFTLLFLCTKALSWFNRMQNMLAKQNDFNLSQFG